MYIFFLMQVFGLRDRQLPNKELHLVVQLEMY